VINPWNRFRLEDELPVADVPSGIRIGQQARRRIENKGAENDKEDDDSRRREQQSKPGWRSLSLSAFGWRVGLRFHSR